MKNDFFEELLREATESFTMQPSKRVWTSIYNNFHPSRKWPSFSSSLFIVFCIMLSGFFNASVTNRTLSTKPIELALIGKPTAQLIQKRQVHYFSPSQIAAAKPLVSLHNDFNLSSSESHTTFNAFVQNKKRQQYHQPAQYRLTIIPGEITDHPDDQTAAIGFVNKIQSTELKEKPVPEKVGLTDQEKQKGTPLSFQFYATPSYGYRFMSRNNPEVIATSSFISNAGPMEEVFNFHQSPALNLEAGGTVLLPLNNDFRLKAGMQFNYTNYKVLGETLPYPFYSNMQLNTPGGGSSLEAHWSEVSNVSNLSTGGELLNNNTFQISLPVGTDVKLMGNDHFRWYAGATIQPSYLMGSNPYLITADMKNYVNDPLFVRKWNVNTSFETFITYQLKGGTILNAGPQIRYQVFSTYNRKYIYDEKLYNIGIKLGITPRF